MMAGMLEKDARERCKRQMVKKDARKRGQRKMREKEDRESCQRKMVKKEGAGNVSASTAVVAPLMDWRGLNFWRLTTDQCSATQFQHLSLTHSSQLWLVEQLNGLLQSPIVRIIV